MQDNVLLIEDSPGKLKPLADALVAKDIQVFDAFGIDLGLDRAEQFRPQLIVIELGAPLGDGESDLQRMAAYGQQNQIPVLYVSEHDCESFRSLTREHAAVGFFPEPYETFDLLMVINMALSSARAMARQS